MAVEFSEKDAATTVFSGPAYNGYRAPTLRATPPSLSPSSLAAPASCPSSPPCRKTRGLVSLIWAYRMMVELVCWMVNLMWVWSIGSAVSVFVVWSRGEDGEPGERSGGAVREWELARLPSRRGNRPPRWRVTAGPGVSRRSNGPRWGFRVHRHVQAPRSSPQPAVHVAETVNLAGRIFERIKGGRSWSQSNAWFSGHSSDDVQYTVAGRETTVAASDAVDELRGIGYHYLFRRSRRSRT